MRFISNWLFILRFSYLNKHFQKRAAYRLTAVSREEGEID
jgi:hypothetical protein